MNITRRTLAKVAAMLTLSDSIPTAAKPLPATTTFEPDPNPDPMGGSIGLMHYVEPNTLFNDMKLPYGYWATSYVDSLDEIPHWGDTFSHYPHLGTDGVPTPGQQQRIEVLSSHDAMHDLMNEFVYGEQRYLRQQNGIMVDLGSCWGD